MGRTYHFDEVREYLTGDEERSLAVNRPVEGSTGEWPDPFPGYVLESEVFVLDRLRVRIERLQGKWRVNEEHRGRIEVIKALLGDGGLAKPVFIAKVDPDLTIRDGLHRSIALLELDSTCVPVFLVKHAGNRVAADDLPRGTSSL